MEKSCRKEDRLFKKYLSLSLLIFLISTLTPAISQETFCKQVANYTMDVRLDTENKTIKATEILSWTNDTSASTDELWFHLYWNAFQNNKSTFLKEASRRGRRISGFKEEDWGYCRVETIKIMANPFFGESDLMPFMEFQYPDDGNLFDQTVFSVSLPRAVRPGQTIQLRIEFESKVPRPISRTGVYRDYYFIAQWFPKIGVFENGQWNCHQYHSASEYFADYGTYDVKITLPANMIVGATGEHREKTNNGDGTTTHHFFQHSVHDFAWTASPHLLEFTEDFEFAPGKTTAEKSQLIET